jgi:endonuclease/exonuclease/phosphatase family metal-dependent hydrolase
MAHAASAQSTGTFIDRPLATDLRVVSYNVEFDTIFSDTNSVQAAKIARILQVLRPDVLNLQEIYDHTAADVASLMNTLLPLPGGESWSAFQGFDNVIVSKYPLSMTRSSTVPNPPSTSYAIGLVDLPDDQFAKDFYFMNGHFKCCGGFDDQRQRQADGLVNWMRDARTAGGTVNLPAGTPMAVVGDLNIVESLAPLNTLLSGDIVNEATFGSDSPPDWDGSSLADAHPLHNVAGPADYTWWNGPDSFAPGRLDYVLYTDSVIAVSQSFVLNTVTMTPAQRAVSGLLQYDVANSPPDNFDHLPLVVDFRFPLPGDYNSDGAVNALDYDTWKAAFGSTNAAADGNGDGTVDAADYTVWRDHFGGGLAATTTVPEPAARLLWWVGLASLWIGHLAQRQGAR